jgi:hypothetical protein
VPRVRCCEETRDDLKHAGRCKHVVQLPHHFISLFFVPLGIEPRTSHAKHSPRPYVILQKRLSIHEFWYLQGCLEPLFCAFWGRTVNLNLFQMHMRSSATHTRGHTWSQQHWIFQVFFCACVHVAYTKPMFYHEFQPQPSLFLLINT